MPSDALKQRALEALRERREAFRSAVATAVDEVRALLEARTAPGNGRGQRAAAELGAFAVGRIDADRFAAVFSDRESLDAAAAERVEAALATLEAVLEAGDANHVAVIEPGGDLRDGVRSALARAGRAFAAAREVEAARAGLERVDHRTGFRPDRWNRAERQIAPPLVVEVDGQDLRPAGLADWIEGGQVIVLIARSPAPPAALARLITPGTFVAQTTDAAALDELLGLDGPAALALVPDGAARFVYRPAAGGAGELRIDALPEREARTLGTLSAERQEADLALLAMLRNDAAGRVAAAAGAAGEPAVEPADRLAAWLLRQADIPDPREA